MTGKRCSSLRPLRNATSESGRGCPPPSSHAIMGVFCARAVDGHATAAPPRSAMNCRRLMALPPERVGSGYHIGGGAAVHRAKLIVVEQPPSFDDLVGAGKHRWRHGQAHCSCRLEVDDQLERRGLLHGKISGLRAPQDLIHLRSSATHHLGKVRPIGHQSPGFDGLLVGKHARQTPVYGEIHILLLILRDQIICQNGQCIGTVLSYCRKRNLEILRASHVMRLERHAKHARRTFCFSPGECVRRIGATPQHSRPREVRDHFLEQFKPFCAKFRGKNRAARYVAPWVGQTGDQSGADRVNGGRNDDRNCPGRIPGREGCGRRAGDDHVGMESNHLLRKLREPLCSTPRVSALDDEVLSLHVAELAQPLEQGSKSCIICDVCDEANSPHSRCGLRPRSKRPRGGRGGENSDEIASLQPIELHSVACKPFAPLRTWRSNSRLTYLMIEYFKMPL